MHTHDTIAAISTAAGTAARGIVRVSGPDALDISDKLFLADDEKPLDGRRGYTRWTGRVALAEGGPSLPAEAYLFRGPRSYTRQDLVELHTCGGPAVLSCVLELAMLYGARQAEPGEFTARAFVAGALDLTEAEGVAALIAARSDAQLRAAERLTHGHLSQRTTELQNRIGDLRALVEADIDFAEEPIDFVSPEQLRVTLDELLGDIDRLLEDAPGAERLDVLPRIVLTGRPNVGKSTLLNKLTGVDRTICSPLAGTTRDVLTAPLALGQQDVLLIDGAGLAATDDTVIGEGQRLVRQEVATADLVCLVIDITTADDETVSDELGRLPQDRTLVVANKTDRLSAESIARRCGALRRATGLEVWPTSGRTGAGCDALKSRFEARVVHQTDVTGAGELALNARHRRALSDARAELRRARTLVASARHTMDCAELLAIELRDASASLGTVVGDVTTEDLLGRIFSQFCVGK